MIDNHIRDGLPLGWEKWNERRKEDGEVWPTEVGTQTTVFVGYSSLHKVRTFKVAI